MLREQAARSVAAVRTYLVERYLPGIGREGLDALVERLEDASAQLRSEGLDVRYLGSFFLPEEESCFCRVEAASAELAVRLNEVAEAPYARISPTLPLGAQAGLQPPEADGAVAPPASPSVAPPPDLPGR